MVCFIGGLAGVVVGLGGGLATSAIAGWRVIFTVAPIVIAFACAFLTGIMFAYLPARKGAQLDPIEALARDWNRNALSPSGSREARARLTMHQLEDLLSTMPKCKPDFPREKVAGSFLRCYWFFRRPTGRVIYCTDQ